MKKLKRAASLADVIGNLDEVIKFYVRQESSLAYFPALYRAVTLKVKKQVESGTVEKGLVLTNLDVAFANRYFDAVNFVISKQAPTRSWQASFDNAARPGTIILQHLFLGMNAHINLDLAVSVVETAVAMKLPLAKMQKDYQSINDILEKLLGPAQKIINSYSPFFYLLDQLGRSADEFSANFSIKVARDIAWRNATRLSQLTKAELPQAIDDLDSSTSHLAQRIILVEGLAGTAISLIAQTETTRVDRVVEDFLTLS